MIIVNATLSLLFVAVTVIEWRFIMNNEQTLPYGCKLQIFEHGDLSGIKLLMQDEYFNFYSSGYHDQEMLVHFRLQELKDSVIFDVGGFMGMSSLMFAKVAPTAHKICCFEPNPSNVERINHNLSLNPELASRIEVYNFALGSKNEFEDMLMSLSVDSGASSTSQLACGDGTDNSHETLSSLGFKTESVYVCKLDSFVKESGLIPNIIKLDIEGAEALFLEGAKETLQKYKPLIYIEFHSIPATLRSMRLLYEAGYNVTILKQEPDKRILAVAEFCCENIAAQMPDYRAIRYELENFRVIHQKDADKIAELERNEALLKKQLTDIKSQFAGIENKREATHSQLIEKETQLTATEILLANSQNQIADSQNQLINKQAQLEASQMQLANIQSQYADIKRQLNDTQAELNDTKAELNDTKAELNDTQSRLDSVLDSTSWKITKPMRAIKKVLVK